YQYQRLIYETELEQLARQQLLMASSDGSQIAIDRAMETLSRAWEEPVLAQWKDRCNELGDDLYKSIGAQLTVAKHFAAPGRGNFLDNMDLPLNDSMWLLDQLASIEKSADENDRLLKIDQILHRTD